MKPLVASLISLLWVASAEARLVLLYVDNPKEQVIRVASADEAKQLDSITDPMLVEKADPDPCVLPPPPFIPTVLTSDTSAAPRPAPPIKDTNLMRLLPKLAPEVGETISLYALSWQAPLEVRGMNTVAVPSEATLPRWVEKEFPKVIKAMAEHASRGALAARLMYGDLGGGGYQKADWETMGVVLPKSAPEDAAPFLTRQDFEFSKALEELTLRPRSAFRPHRVRFIARLPWNGKSQCPAALAYPALLKDLERRESSLLSALTGWPEGYTLSRQGIHPANPPEAPPRWP